MKIIIKGLIAAAAWLQLAGSVAVAEEQHACYEFPVVVVSALDRSFPDATCNQRRYPAEECLKQVVTSRIEVIDHNEPGRLNCYGKDAPSAVYETTKTNYRGQTSLFFPKHQMNVKFAHDTSFLGMAADKAFILNGPFLDCTLLRNHMAHWLYRSTGRYSPHTRLVVLYFKQSPDDEAPEYYGIYLLMEKIGYGPNRVNLAKMDHTCDGAELNGGWAWQNDPLSYNAYSPNVVIDQYQNEFGMGERPILAYPSGSDLSQKMRDYFVGTSTGFLPQLYRFLWNNMTNPDGLEEHLDLGSFADYILHTEMSLNVDAYRRSTMFFKDRDQTINAGPVWDLNLAYGNGARRDFHDWIYPQYTYWKRLVCNYKLASLIIQRWKALRADGGVWSDNSIATFIDQSAVPIRRQLSKCTGDWRSNVLQCAAVSLKDCNATYEVKIDNLKTAVLNRARWMDEHILDFYKKLDANTCSGVGTIPDYNCAQDGSDGGCLTDPVKYYSAVQFPAIREPYTGPSCGSRQNSTTSNQQLTKYSLPSVDNCWRSAGLYVYPEQKGVREKSLTHFCSGYGTCPEGPGAKCVCRPGMLLEKESCRRIDAEDDDLLVQKAVVESNLEHSAISASVQNQEQPASGNYLRLKHSLMAGLFGCVILCTSFIAAVRLKSRRKSKGNLNTYRPVRYGSVDDYRRFSASSI